MQNCKLTSSMRLAKGSDGAIALNIQNGQMFSINAIGAFILEGLRAERTKTEIVAEIVTIYEVEADKALLDYAEFVKDLETHNLAFLDAEDAS